MRILKKLTTLFFPGLIFQKMIHCLDKRKLSLIYNIFTFVTDHTSVGYPHCEEDHINHNSDR